MITQPTGPDRRRAQAARVRRLGTVSYAAAMFVVVSILMGLLAAGLVVPAAALAGTGSRAAADGLELLPQDLETPPQPERSRVLAGDGSVLASFFDENRVYVPLEKIAPVMRLAQVAIEDHRFYEHGAIDLKGTMRALLQNSAGGATQGGSSITQQYVKMVQLEKAKSRGDDAGVTAAQERTYGRKIQEMRYAIALEKRLSKDEILERYLNIAYFGDGAYGVEQAARHYFDKTAGEIDLAEAAMLAGLVRNPAATDPTRFPEVAVERRNVVINRMQQLGLVNTQEAAKGKATTWNPDNVKPAANGCVDAKFPFLCDYVRRTLLENEALGKTPQDRESRLLRGGLTIRTKIDTLTQEIAERAIADLVGPEDPAISTMTMVEPGTGLIMAMAQSRPEMGEAPGQTFYNYAVRQSMGGAEGFQAGSTFKAYTAAAALDKGIPATKRYDSPSRMDFSNTEFRSCEGPVRVPAGYRPKNSTRSGPNMTMTYAMDWSVNTYFLQLARDTGMCRVTKMMDRLGVQLANGEKITSQSGIFSLPLGSVDVTPLSMANAYATLAADGVHCNPVIIASITTSEGKRLPVPDADCRRVIGKDVARGVTRLLQSVMKGTGSPADPDNGHDIAGKTGATDNSEAVWFCGYSPEVAGCSSIAVDKTHHHWKGKHRSLTGLSLPRSGPLTGDGGGDAGAKVWKPAMTEALQDREKKRFKEPSARMIKGRVVDMPGLDGLTADQAEQKLSRAGFSVVRSMINNDAARGTYLGTSPTGRAREYGEVQLLISAGPVVKSKQAQEKSDNQARKKKGQRERKKEQQKRQSHDGREKRSGDR